MDRDERACAKALVDVERAVRIDVDALVAMLAAHPVPPDRHHAADREQGCVDRVALADVVEDGVIGEVDIAGVMQRDATESDGAGSLDVGAAAGVTGWLRAVRKP